MAGLITFTGPSAVSTYITITDSAGNWWNGVSFEVYNEANWSSYGQTSTEYGTSGVYFNSVPGFGAGNYEIIARQGIPILPSNTIISVGQIAWDGASVTYLDNATIWANTTRTLTAGTNILLPSNALAAITAWTVNITGNLSGSVGSIATGGITAASITAAAAEKVSDIFFRRAMSSVFASSFGDAVSKNSLYGQIQQGQKSSVAATTQTVLNTDGSTLGTFTLSVSASADPVTGIA